MSVYFVGAGPGDPELLTRKAARLLSETPCCIWAGSLVNPALLEMLPDGAAIHDSAGMNLEQIIDVIAKAHEQGLSIVRLHTGDPSIYGAIAEQMDRLDELGIDYQVIPGVSSFQAAAASLPAELTAPEVSQTIILSRVAGRTPVPESQSIAALAQTRATLCLFLSVGRLETLATELAEYYGPACPAAVIYHASWPDEIILRGTLDDIAAKVEEAGITKTAMIIVGHALTRPLKAASKLYAAHFTHEYRQGSDDA
jgi:precorrin-4/cobalt-precorrin-4 C11-methyltransferase